jgi:membrane-bound ClpP family serine protease
MEKDYRQQNQKGFGTLQSIRHITMGLLLVAMGVVFFVADRYQIKGILDFDKTFRYIFGGIILLYGAFRFYRGIKKDY